MKTYKIIIDPIVVYVKVFYLLPLLLPLTIN